MLPAASKRNQFYHLWCVGRFHLRIVNTEKLEWKETEEQILNECGCSYGILMRVENFENVRRCDYHDEVRCVKHILQDYLYNGNRSSDKKCLPPCKGVNFEANKVTVSPGIHGPKPVGPG